MIRVWNDTIKINEDYLDAFGRLRVSEPVTLLDITHTNGKNELLIDEYTTGVSSTFYDSNASHVDLVVSGTGTATRQSRKYCIYQPGKSLLVFCTGVLNANANNISTTSRIGYFDDNNGFFFEYSNNGSGQMTVKVVHRTNATGSVVNNKVEQINWNINKLNNNLNGNYIFDSSKVQIFVIDIEWLGVGRVRMGIVHNGKLYYVHHFYFDNVYTSVHTTNANLPVRYQITSSGGNGTLRQICATVISEGGYTPQGLYFSSNNLTFTGTGAGFTTVTPRAFQNTDLGIKHPMFTIYLNPLENIRKLVIPTDLQIMGTNSSTNDIFIYSVDLYRFNSNDAFNVPITGGTMGTITNSCVSYIIEGTYNVLNTVQPLTILTGYISGKETKILNSDIAKAFSGFSNLSANINGTSDYIVIAIRCINDNPNGNRAYISMQWQELF